MTRSAVIPVDPKPLTLTEWVKTEKGAAATKRIINDALVSIDMQYEKVRDLQRLLGVPVCRKSRHRHA